MDLRPFHVRPSFKALRASLSVSLFIACFTAAGQDPTPVLDSNAANTYRVVLAGKYPQSGLRNFFLGRHYRTEWETPVRVPVVMLDTFAGGLTPYEAGGGRQSKSLKLRDRNNREYVLRSLDKSFGRALPPEMSGTFIEDLVDDQVTIGHPYSAFTIADMAEAANILHTAPLMVYVPRQPALDSFSDRFGDLLYLLEQRPDENWETEPRFANSKKIIGTEKLLEKLLEHNSNSIDQRLYVRSRLFDMFIGDWGRHEDQWRWALVEEGDHKVYKPIPRDRDQAYTKFDGLLPKLVLRAANLDHLQSFTYRVEEVKEYGFPARHLDRRATNETTYDEWIAIAKELQQSLTDEVIESSLRQMPPEVFPISGPWIIDQLKSRRDRLQDVASIYYRFLARHVDIPGTSEDEYFEVKRLSDDLTSVQVFRIEDNEKLGEPFYSRVFKTNETEDIRLFGIAGQDVFHIDGQVNDGIKVLFIGGPDTDSVIDQSHVSGLQKKTRIYDDRNNSFATSPETKIHYGSDSAHHAYNYHEFAYHKKGVHISAFYDNPDRFYVGLGYGFKRHMWRRYPYGFEQMISGRYSLSQNAFSILYEGVFHQLIRRWDVTIFANYDAVRWTNFSGLGNETVRPVLNRDYYRLRTNEFIGSLGFSRTFAARHNVEVTAGFNAVEIIEDTGHYVTDHITPNQLYFTDHHQFASIRAGYTYQHVDDNIVPTRGAMLYAGAAYTQNTEIRDRSFTTVNGIAHLFIPLFGKFSISTRSGISTVSGKPEFYQYASTGGSQTLRGYRRDRFWGQTAFYNSNELRWITNFKSYLMTGKVGLVGFVDDGRVWMPGESSGLWHVGYGGGFLLAPFNKLSVSVTYGVSEEDKVLHLRLNKLLF